MPRWTDKPVLNGSSKITTGSTDTVARTIGKPKWDKPLGSQMMVKPMNRGLTFNRGPIMGRPMMMGPRPVFRAGFGFGRRFF